MAINTIENIRSLVLDVSFGDEKFPQMFIVCKIAQDSIILPSYVCKDNQLSENGSPHL